MNDLTDRCERAGVDETRGLLDEVWALIHGERPCLVGKALHEWLTAYMPFQRKLDAEAYLDAAMMLWEGDCSVSREQGRGVAFTITKDALGCDVTAATPALALLAAILRAQAKDTDDER